MRGMALAPPNLATFNYLSLGECGQRRYRRERERWYQEHTGRELTGSIAEQNEQWDNYKRNFRARGTDGNDTE